MKIDGKVTKIDALKKVFPEGVLSESESKITLLASRLINESERPGKCKNITDFLLNEGYSDFAIRLNENGAIEIVDSGAFNQGLAKWISQEKGYANEAAEKIRDAFYNNLPRLDLSDLNLKSLPPEIGKLTNMTQLWLRNNQLKELPTEIWNLKSLTALSLSHNKFKILPHQIGQLVNLNCLWLSDNLLKDLPPEIWNLSHLIRLGLENNRLQSLPPQIARLLYLMYLDVSNNKDLSELPLALGSCWRIAELKIIGTRISEKHLNAILQLAEAYGAAEASPILGARLKAWRAVSGQSFKLGAIGQLTSAQQRILSDWLIRLENSKDFPTVCQKPLAKTVCNILQSLQDPDFKETFFAQVPYRGGGGEARALNEIVLACELAELEADCPDEERLALMIGAAKTAALRSALQQRVVFRDLSAGESVGIYLYYENALRDKLDLLTAINGISSGMDKYDWIDESALIEEVNKTYLDHIVKFASLQTFLEEEEDYPVNEELALRMKALEEKKNEMPGDEYARQMDDVQKELDLAYKTFALKYIEEHITD